MIQDEGYCSIAQIAEDLDISKTSTLRFLNSLGERNVEILRRKMKRNALKK